MREIVNGMQYAFAALGGALGAVLGGWDGFLYGLIVFVVVDYLTGLMAAAMENHEILDGRACPREKLHLVKNNQ